MTLRKALGLYNRAISHVITVSIFLFSALSAQGAPPKAVTYQDALRFHQWSTVTGDWSQTKAFNIEKPVEFDAIVVSLETVRGDAGYVTLQFQLDLPRDAENALRVGPDYVYNALLQTVSEVDRLDIPTSQLGRGDRVTLRGWPATRQSYLPHMMLVESVTVNGTRYGLHDDNTALQARIEGADSSVPPE